MKLSTAQKLLSITREGYVIISEQFNKTRQHFWADFSVFEPFVKDGCEVLDVGCGNGRLFKYLTQKHEIQYVGIDSSEKLIQIAEKNFSTRSGRQNEESSGFDSSLLKQAKFYTADILKSETLSVLGCKKFDVIFCIAALHHIPTKELQLQALITIKHYLKPGGVFCMENWNMWELRKGNKTVWSSNLRKSNLGIPFNELSLRDVITAWKTVAGIGYLYYHAFRVSELRVLLGYSGLQVQTVYYIRDGKKAHWWNGKNIIAIAKNGIL